MILDKIFKKAHFAGIRQINQHEHLFTKLLVKNGFKEIGAQIDTDMYMKLLLFDCFLDHLFKKFKTTSVGFACNEFILKRMGPGGSIFINN